MATTLTRQALYELVWTRPRKTLAAELGISDVAIGKHCVRAQVPAPPPGYWAKLSAGVAVTRTPLPTRLPGQSDIIEMGRDPRAYWITPVPSDDAPPVFLEVLELQVGEALRRIGRVTSTRDLHTPDPALKRVLEAEARRRTKCEKDGWVSDKPYFDGSIHQRQLRIFNSLARAFAPLYGRQEVRCEDEWIHGVGTLHHLVLHLRLGTVGMALRVLEPSDRNREKGSTAVAATTLRVGNERDSGGVLEWRDTADQKLESRLTEIVGQLLRRAEVSLRAHAQWCHEQRLKEREEERLAAEARKREEEKRRLAEIEARKKKVRDEIVEIARRRSVAEQIRSTVEALREHPEVVGGGRDRFQAWAEHALLVAASIDPMSDSLDRIVGSFEVGAA
jgi:hypothetical protein